ncbi:amino acid adenylation domain-containing protein [Pseudonocardia sp. MCCB 268]|nr:amino acid adenylation domain-containing protein [Pseudonocardia cytotoxica]
MRRQGAHRAVLLSHLARWCEQIDCSPRPAPSWCNLDAVAPLVDELDGRRLIDAERVPGQPAGLHQLRVGVRASEGVAIDHPSICNFVKVAAETYRIRPEDRVYQGMALAFDFAVERSVPWSAGLMLVPRSPALGLLGPALAEFVNAHRVTALCTARGARHPDPAGLPGLRSLLVCGRTGRPGQLRRWCRPGRRFLNVYGPTEATVTATPVGGSAQVGPVTIGIPPGRRTAPWSRPSDLRRALPHGCQRSGSPGSGWPAATSTTTTLTEQVFIRDFLGSPATCRGVIYRTGDLGRVNANGEPRSTRRVDGRDREHDRYGPGTALAPPPPPRSPPGSQAVASRRPRPSWRKIGGTVLA